MKNDRVQLVITSGEPAGIGPQISFLAAHQFLENHDDVNIVLLGDKELFQPYQQAQRQHANLSIKNSPLRDENRLGQLNKKNAPYVLGMLDIAFQGCLDKQYDAMVTAPLQKSIINDFGISFTGHTEYLAEKAGVSQVVMMLCGEVSAVSQVKPTMMRVALASTHIALKDVSLAMNSEEIYRALEIIHQCLRKYFGISNPRISVAGLNPHAGENGYLGDEEINIILPAIKKAQMNGISAIGPFPADTMFRYDNLEHADVFLAMYHDQGLIPLKMATFGHGVNVTLGLPIIRTSVDHGTALDLAQNGKADFGSMYEALRVAYQMVKNDSSSA
jgi:4-hydroxythreonine-4-phosphate dehydrogenase